jgi:hypothetical protein
MAHTTTATFNKVNQNGKKIGHKEAKLARYLINKGYMKLPIGMKLFYFRFLCMMSEMMKPIGAPMSIPVIGAATSINEAKPIAWTFNT